jgi:hypothetical protein
MWLVIFLFSLFELRLWRRLREGGVAAEKDQGGNDGQEERAGRHDSVTNKVSLTSAGTAALATYKKRTEGQ